jgi:phosphoglycerate dehydrogenase-like enzyme
MPGRVALRKVVFTWEADDRLVGAVRDLVPDATVVSTGSKDELSREIVDANMTIGPGYDEEIMRSASQLAWHHVPWAGVERIASPLMAEKGIVLTNSRGISAPNMAEHAIAFILAFARAFPDFWQEQQRRSWRGWENPPTFFELSNQTVVLLGTGAIGMAIATRLRPFGCRIIGVRRTGGSLEHFDDVVTFDRLEEILPEADHVVSTLPITPFTEKIVDRAFIERMKPGSYFHNLGRGGTVDQDALIEALHRGHLAGAGLDVTDPEPLPEDSPLWDAPNTIITGHTSGNSPLFMDRAVALLQENLRRWQDGDDLVSVVDLEYGY